MQKKMIFLALGFVLLAGCLPGQNPQDVSSQVNTAVAQTMEANNRVAQSVDQTLTAQVPFFTATLAFTPTEEPTFEPIIIITDTPPPSPTFTNSPPPPRVVESTPQSYSCFVTTLTPDAYEEIKAGQNFEIRWSIKNTGIKAWDAGIDLKYAGGVQMTTATRAEIPKSLAPGESYKISLNAKAPNHKGTQQMTWIVEGQLCYANVVITVK